MTVYAVNSPPPDMDITPAKQYGDIRYISMHYVYGDEIDNRRLPALNLDALQLAADNFDPEHDFVLLIGDWLQLAAFLKLLGARHHSICVLRWDKKAEGYLPVWL
jgi:hypothetical protein